MGVKGAFGTARKEKVNNGEDIVKKKTFSQTVKIVSSFQIKENWLKSLNNYCIDNPNELVTIIGPVDRNRSSIQSDHWLENSIFCYSELGNYVRVAMEKGLHIVGEDSNAIQILRIIVGNTDGLGIASRWLEKIVRCSCMRNAELTNGEPYFDCSKEQGGGVFLVRLNENRR